MNLRVTVNSRILISGLFFVLVGGVLPVEATAEVVAVVSANSKVVTLTTDQVADIFLGKTNRFPDGSKATPLDQKEGSAERGEFYLEFAGKSAAQVKAHWSKIIFTGRGEPPAEVADGQAAREAVAQNLDAIVYIDRSLVDDTVRVVAP
jgi:ABC-type phosphate transport system substrate-binding protein